MSFDFSLVRSSKEKRLPACTADLRRSLRPREDLERLKRYALSQKHLLLHLIKTQRSITSEYFRQSTRSHYQLNGMFPRHPEEDRSPPKEVPVQRSFSRASISVSVERKPISVPVIKFRSCSQLIAEGHGIVRLKHSTIPVSERSQQWNESIFHEEISLSRSRPRRFRRTALVRQTPSKVSATYSFATPDQLAQNVRVPPEVIA